MTKHISIPDHNETSPKRSSGATAGAFTFVTVDALDPETGRRVAEADTIENEVKVLFKRADAALAEAGLSRKDLVKSTCWISDEAHRFDFLYAYRDECATGVYPQRITMSVGLPGDCRGAIEFVAVAQ
ncbi:MAG: RidA family protein [Leucobacter sp.]|nr:RidA family protein [Leucobacter sp.]